MLGEPSPHLRAERIALGVGAGAVAKLVQDRGAGQPQLVAGDPFVHRGQQGRMPFHQDADDVRGESVDGVPPRFGDDEMPYGR